MTMPALALAGLLIAACADSRAAMPVPPGTQFIVGVDISGSRTPTQLAEGEQLVGGLIDRMHNGDRLVFVQTYQAGTDAAGQWADSIPVSRTPATPTGNDRRRAERFRQTARMIAGTFFDSLQSKQIMTTDLLFTLARASDYARAAGGRRTTLLLMSDMLNATPELNMERDHGVPDPQWVAQRKSQGRLPDLHGVCVVVSGADVTSARGARVRAFWKAYFEAAGATWRDGNYRNLVADAGQVGCGS